MTSYIELIFIRYYNPYIKTDGIRREKEYYEKSLFITSNV